VPEAEPSRAEPSRVEAETRARARSGRGEKLAAQSRIQDIPRRESGEDGAAIGGSPRSGLKSAALAREAVKPRFRARAVVRGERNERKTCPRRGFSAGQGRRTEEDRFARISPRDKAAPRCTKRAVRAVRTIKARVKNA